MTLPMLRFMYSFFFLASYFLVVSIASGIECLLSSNIRHRNFRGRRIRSITSDCYSISMSVSSIYVFEGISCQFTIFLIVQHH